MAIIELLGTIDGAGEAALDRAYTAAAAAGVDVVALDFDDVDYINSTGIALLVGLLARARRDGLPVRAWGLSDHYREIFSLIRLDEAIGIHDDATAAVAASRA